jgi:hypothetical protein
VIVGDETPATLAVEPSWQVYVQGFTGLVVDRMSIEIAGGGSVSRIDEIRIATDWASLVSGLVAPVSASPRITSFTAAGGSDWEVSLKGDANTLYEFRSSTTLDFSPGSMVQNLTHDGVAVPAGSISGDNNEFVTTDGSGDATVRMTLSGAPKEFIRAQTSNP